MKRFIPFGLALVSITSVNAQMPDSSPVKMTNVHQYNTGNKSAGMMKMKSLSEDVIVRGANGKAVIRNGQIARPSAMRRVPGESAKKGYALYENFSGWDGKSANWLPDGWTAEHRGEGSAKTAWIPFEPSPYYPALADGQYCYFINDNQDQLMDEWLITPEFTPEEEMELSYYLTMTPFWFYDTTNYDYLLKEYVGGKQTLYTFQVLIQEGEGEWEVLRDYAEEYFEYTYNELISMSNISYLVKEKANLDKYAGKNVKLAFRYYGKDGNMMMLDAVGVGYPTLDDIWYLPPAHTLYWGFYNGDDSSQNFFQQVHDIAVFPANTPITWTNASGDAANFTWEYMDPATSLTTTSDEQYELSVTYPPTRPTTAPKVYETPVLKAEAPRRVDGLYNSPVTHFQAGGTAFAPVDGVVSTYSMMQYPLVYQDVAFTDVREGKLGAFSVPVYGHNEFTDDYWLIYCLNGEEKMEGDYVHLTGYGNVYFASEEAPLVINGLHFYGWGYINGGAELTATIYALDSEMHSDYDTFTPIARATIKGDKVVYANEWNYKDNMYIPFKFDEPVVLQASEEHPAFVFMLEGFNSDQVDYFAPLQSHRPNDSGVPSGYILSEINLANHIGGEPYRSFKPMQY
ncbi:MAG: choice-of-anchor J domain-containing protein, partial [Muribaculaceae bacterium]|nr:choice-of-anchor J domain-containing protein [Muribaculaceae bacterium]